MVHGAWCMVHDEAMRGHGHVGGLSGNKPQASLFGPHALSVVCLSSLPLGRVIRSRHLREPTDMGSSQLAGNVE